MAGITFKFVGPPPGRQGTPTVRNRVALPGQIGHRQRLPFRGLKPFLHLHQRHVILSPLVGFRITPAFKPWMNKEGGPCIFAGYGLPILIAVIQGNGRRFGIWFNIVKTVGSRQHPSFINNGATTVRARSILARQHHLHQLWVGAFFQVTTIHNRERSRGVICRKGRKGAHRYHTQCKYC